MIELALALASVLSSSDDVATRRVPYDHAALRHGGVYDASTGVLSPPVAGLRGPTVGEAIYRNTAPSGFFYNVADGALIIDEGRVPSTSSSGIVGTQDSYSLSSLSIAYVTDATDVSAGGTGVGLRLQVFERFEPCGLLVSTDEPLVTVDLVGLPGSLAGGFESVVVDVDLTGLGVCLRADGDGASGGPGGDLFGWSLQVTDPGDGSMTGPLISGDPNAVPSGDGTVFQNPGAATGSGLATADRFTSYDFGGTISCLFFGGYPFGGSGQANARAAFYLVLRSDLSGDCIGCGIADDRFEPNTAFTDAASLSLGRYSGLISDDTFDFYSVSLEPHSGLVLDVLFEHAVADLDLVVYDNMQNILEASLSVTDDERVILGNCTAAPIDLFVQISNIGGTCAEYDLLLRVDPLFGDDALEENDDCASAADLPLDVTRDLVLRPVYCDTADEPDDDFYRLRLADGAALTVDVLFDHDTADVDLALLDLSGGCPGVLLDESRSVDDNETVRWLNGTGGAVDVLLHVEFVEGASVPYDMRANVGGATLGELVCIGETNSTGSNGTLTARGSIVAQDNILRLDATDLPQNALGYFIVSQNTILLPNPGGSAGNICIGSVAIGRYAGDILNSGAGGGVTFQADLLAVPLPSATGPTTAIVAGDTLCFQLWHRDQSAFGMTTSNFTDAICVTFE